MIKTAILNNDQPLTEEQIKEIAVDRRADQGDSGSRKDADYL